MKTVIFDVTGRGRFPLDQLRRFCLYPYDVETAQKIEWSFEESETREYRLGMNCETEYSVPDVIARFASFGFHTEVAAC